jgi:2-polyprenyl-3-methyl-5-hydroxy-6-metoxy-1,4-benzoquinol methylase
MPTSALVVWPHIIGLVHQVPHDHILDVGPGWGKAAVLLREYLNEKPRRIDAIEVEKSYVEAHGLSVLYDNVFVGDVTRCPAGFFDPYQVVIMGDVIEHLTDDDAFALLRRIRGRVVISTPVAWFQTDEGLPESERHRSHWTEWSWNVVEQIRHVETAYQHEGAWLVRLAPLPVRSSA